MRTVPRSFYRRDALEVAPALLNKLLVVGERSGRIVEVEAYRGGEDPGSHAYRGLTRRNATMFGPPGHLYVYFSYGVHWCANVVCQPAGVPHALLVRALAPVGGLSQMRTARARGQKKAVSDRDLCRGPGRLCQALGLGGEYDGADLVSGAGAGGMSLTGDRAAATSARAGDARLVDGSAEPTTNARAGTSAVRLVDGSAAATSARVRDVTLADSSAAASAGARGVPLGDGSAAPTTSARAGGVRLMDDGTPPPDKPGVSLRVGLTQGADLRWRFFVPGDRHVSGRS